MLARQRFSTSTYVGGLNSPGKARERRVNATFAAGPHTPGLAMSISCFTVFSRLSRRAYAENEDYFLRLYQRLTDIPCAGRPLTLPQHAVSTPNVGKVLC